ncbi:MAG: helix-turn-helix domain-containing protein [Planctomycetota bacterium]
MSTPETPRFVLCLGLSDVDRSRLSEEAHRFGWQVRYASDVEEARQRTGERTPDLVLFSSANAGAAANELIRQCTARTLQALPNPGSTSVTRSANEDDDEGTVLLEPGSILRFEDYEQQILRHALHTTGWNVKRAAQLLGIGRATLYRKIDRYKLREFQPDRSAG